MNYRIEEKGEFRIVGVKKWVSTMNNQQMEEIPEFWNQFPGEKMQQLRELSKTQEVVALCADMYDQGFDYWIGAITEERCPEDMDEKKMPSSTWAIFEVIGPMRPLPITMQETWRRIYSEWLPHSDYGHAGIPGIEHYSNGDLMSSTYRSEIWIPVIKS